MKILYLGSSADWHVDTWVRYFTKDNQVFLFSDNVFSLKDQPFDNVKVYKSYGILGSILNFFRIKSRFFFQFNKIVSIQIFVSKIKKIVKEDKIDIIHAHSLYFGFLASFINLKLPVVFTPMGSDVIRHAQNNFFYKHMAERAFQNCNITTSDSLLLQKKGFNVGAKKENNYIIQNGVDHNIFYPKGNNLKNKFKVKSDEILLFSPRAITPLYNIDIILESISMLKDKGYGIKCMFSYAFGDNYLSFLKEQIIRLDINDNVIWLGYLDYEQMAEHYNAADIIISIPSSDSSPKSVYEAMFCKKPVIVSDLEWTYEILGNLNSFCRVGVRDSLDLFESIKTLINDKEIYNKISNNGFKNVKKYFDYEKNMKKMENIMFDYLNNNLS